MYERIYQKLVEEHKHLIEEWKPVGSGLERHRILPGHQGGTYVDSNCTYLTKREHILAHWLLWKIYKRVGDKKAFSAMKGQPSLSPHLGAKRSEETCKRISLGNKGKKRTQEFKDQKSKSQIGSNNTFYGKKHSKETLKRMSEKRKGTNHGTFPVTNEELIKHGRILLNREGKLTTSLWMSYAKENNLPTCLTSKPRFSKFSSFVKIVKEGS